MSQPGSAPGGDGIVHGEHRVRGIVEQAGRELRSVAHRRFTGVMDLQLGASSMWKRSQSVACDTNWAAWPGDYFTPPENRPRT
jgi:hypothetical protein